jgi:uncharacterized membrane protein HdeD (DUF308 family)
MTAIGLYLAALSIVAGVIALFYTNTDTALELLLGALLLVSGIFLAFFALRDLLRQRAMRGPFTHRVPR